MIRTQIYIITQNSTYNYMFPPCILAIVRLYYKLNKQLYNMCVGGTVGGTGSRLTVVGGMVLEHYGPVLIHNNALVYYYKPVENQISVHKLSTCGDKRYPINLKVHLPNLFLDSNNALNPLNAELNPICHLLASLGAHHFLHVSRIRVNLLKPSGFFTYYQV